MPVSGGQHGATRIHGVSGPGGLSATPQPGTIVLMTTGLLALGRRRFWMARR